MKIEDMDNKINSTNENAKIKQKRRVITLILLAFIMLLMSLSCLDIFGDDDKKKEPDLSWDERIATGVKSTELEMKKTADFYIATEERETFFAPTQTAYWSTQGPELTLNSIKRTQTHISSWKTRDVVVLTSDVKYTQTFSAEHTAQSKRWTEEASDEPPVINMIDFPSLIPKTGEQIRGLLYFSDPDGDVVSQKCEVISATAPHLKCGTTDVTKRLVSGTWYNGAIWLGLRCCCNNNNITLRMTLIDSKGNVSNPKNVSFSCR